MSRPLSRIGFALAFVSTIGVLLFASSGAQSNQFRYQYLSLQQQRRMELYRSGAKPSYQWRHYGRIRHIVPFSTAIQHIVVIDMENRTVDNLFSAYYNMPFRGSTAWNTVMNLADPNSLTHPLTPHYLEDKFDPHHRHQNFLDESGLGFDHERFTCNVNCPGTLGAYSYVPAIETNEYAQFIQNYAFADEVFQANQGPSMPSHQYLIAGQSGGFTGMNVPFALANNPCSWPCPEPPGNDDDQSPVDGSDTVYCGPDTLLSASLNMTLHQPEPEGGNNPIPPCVSYTNGTILDEMARMGTPRLDNWQYISAKNGGYWSAPTAVQNLYNQWHIDPNPQAEPFVKDPNAYTFDQNLQSSNPTRPFAALTFITPCTNASDHADTSGNNKLGPRWLGKLINDIGTAQGGAYWNSTVIIVTWDDWGGWYDHVNWIESINNPYPDGNGNPPNQFDPNEWGYRVPLIVISPYVKFRGYVSHTPRSQSAILSTIETFFGLDSLRADDLANDDIGGSLSADMFDFSHTLPFVKASIPPGYSIPPGC